MYNCGLCKTTSNPGQPRLVHYVKGEDNQIKREIPVCELCASRLHIGIPVGILEERFRKIETGTLPEAQRDPQPVIAKEVGVKLPEQPKTKRGSNRPAAKVGKKMKLFGQSLEPKKRGVK